MEKERIQRAIGLERRNYGTTVIKGAHGRIGLHGGALKRHGQILRKIGNKWRETERERERERERDSDAIPRKVAKLRQCRRRTL